MCDLTILSMTQNTVGSGNATKVQTCQELISLVIKDNKINKNVWLLAVRHIFDLIYLHKCFQIKRITTTVAFLMNSYWFVQLKLFGNFALQIYFNFFIRRPCKLKSPGTDFENLFVTSKAWSNVIPNTFDSVHLQLIGVYFLI